jgi:PAS domain S-box-containing protein
MIRHRLPPLLSYGLFALALVAAAQVREYGYDVLDQSVMWLPTGVAVAGLWLLGLRAWWLVAVCTLGTRLLLGYEIQVAVPGALGSTAEAVVGALVLQRAGFEPRLERLRDVLALCAAATLAPVASILCSWLGRAFVWTDPHMPFYSGWDGWWRMNALGLLTVVPLVATWLAAPRPTYAPRGLAQLGLLLLLQAALVGVVFTAWPPGVTGIMLLNLVVLVALYAAVRLGPRGAVSAGALAAVLIALGTANGRGPFLAVARAERHVALQLFELLLVGLPLAFGALAAGRRSAVAERERSDEELHRSRELLAAIHRNVNEGLYRSLPDGGLLYANQAFATMFGYETADEILGTNAMGLHVEPERREALKRVVAERGFIANEEVRFRRRDGTLFWGLVSSTAVRGPDGVVTCFDGAITDVTAWKGLEEQLRQSQRLEAVGQLAGGIAHDFNNVLTAIVGYAELIHSALPATDPSRPFADGVLRAAERAATLTRQLLAYSRRQVLSPRVLELGDVVRQLGDMLQRLIGENVRLQIDTDPDGCWARVDRGQFEQVILNLVVNARDAMPDGGTVTIEADTVELDDAHAIGHADLPAGIYVKLVVRDTGLGMSGEVRARAFDPFFTTKERSKGSGLGLSTVYGIVKQSGGDVTLDSRPGGGTEVTIHLPRVAAESEPEPEAAALPGLPAAATLLLAEDEPVVRELTGRFLEFAGFRVIVASDGQEALEKALACDGPLDVLITDVVMPRLGGRELAARLLAARPQLRVLFISGYAEDAGDVTTVAGHAGDFLEKPYRPEVLIARVRALLDRTPQTQ